MVTMKHERYTCENWYSITKRESRFFFSKLNLAFGIDNKLGWFKYPNNTKYYDLKSLVPQPLDTPPISPSFVGNSINFFLTFPVFPYEKLSVCAYILLFYLFLT